MPAYGFKKRFVRPILDGTKPQTMREKRTGKVPHARPGQTLFLYTAMRTKQCRKIGEATCKAVLDVTLDFVRRSVTVEGRGTISKQDGLDAFAVKDGFTDWLDLVTFWMKGRKKKQPPLRRWSGVLIEWEGFKADPKILEEAVVPDPS